MTETSLYERLGGAFAIAAVVDHFSEAIVKNPIVGQTSENPALREWHTNKSGQASGPQIHAHPVGLRGRRRPPAICSDETGKHHPWPRGSPPRTEDLSRRVR